MTHDADRDPEFEAFLRRRSPLHRRLSQIDHAEPSQELDRIVLDRARDAIGAPPQEPIYRKSRWAMPLGLAATILIAFTVVLNIDHRRAGSLSPQASNASARLADSPAAPSVQQPALASRALVESREKAEGDDAPFPDAASVAEIVSRRDSTTASSRSGVVNWGATSAANTPPASAPAADFRASPEAWLLEINHLRAAGKNDEADRELAAFRRAHPAHPGYSLAQPPTR